MNRPSPDEFVASLVQFRDPSQQQAFLQSSGIFPTPAVVEALSQAIREMCPRDPALAETLADTNLAIASRVDTPLALAQATRSRAQVLYTMRRSAEAQLLFEKAVDLFTEAGKDEEVGRTLVTAMDNLSYLGRYEDAIQLEARARAALQNDPRYLANLGIALGNLYYRLDRLPESLAQYDSVRGGDPVSVAAVGMGRAHVLTDMNRFDEALAAFTTTKEHCERYGLALWADIALRGISRMLFLRGSYSSALAIVEQVRRRHEAAGDSRRMGLCDLERSEIYLQLNLFEEASSLAKRASEIFSMLNNRYEGATCLMFRGIAEFKLLNDAGADAAFLEARDMFTLEGNAISVALVDLWRGQMLMRQQQFDAAQELALRAARTFARQQVPVRAANARVLAAQSLERLGRTEDSNAEAETALNELDGFDAPWVSYQAYNTLGRIKEKAGALQEAQALYLQAVSALESLRGNIGLDELRMSFGKDKYQVYENLVDLKLSLKDPRSAFEFVERSKSRTLIDLLERNLETAWDASSAEGNDSSERQRIRKAREELNILYNRQHEAGTTARRIADDHVTRAEIARRERELVELLRESGGGKTGWSSLTNVETMGVETVQGMLEPREVLIEYYAVGDRLDAFVIGRDAFHVVSGITSTPAVRASLKGLNFQLSKFNLGPVYLQAHSARLIDAAKHHLAGLYRQLIAPLESWIPEAARLIVVPHQALHYVPFHALYDGQQFVIDRYAVSYGASATVLGICRRRTASGSDHDLILAAADERTPFIDDEVAALQGLLPNARVFTGAQATEAALREHAPSAGKIHIAAHGVFRSDNPMFSSLRLGDSWLNLFDIFNLRLGAELTTLSACETGMSSVFEGDELLGLARGFLYAGTPSLVVSLWTVNDRSTAQLMRRFYAELEKGAAKADALRDAILEVKADFPHPYYWAAFVLMGKSA